MISKLDFQSIIEKYHLNGLVENVKWEIDSNKNLTINFMSPTREMIGKVTSTNFPLPESSIGISDTTQLDKLLSITSGDLILDYAKEGKIVAKLLIADNQFNLNYSLADLLTVPKPGEYKGLEEYDIEAILDNETITALVKAKNALSNSESVVVKPGLNGLEFTFGGDIEYANKVTYSIQNINTIKETRFELIYNSNLLKEILINNKGAESGLLSIRLDGLIKIEFNHKNIKSKYYLVAKAE